MARDGKPTRNKILAESKLLVLENGFSGTSIDQILARTGITKGAFFYHFKTKNALAKALIEEYAAEDKKELDRVLTATDLPNVDAKNRLLQFVQAYIDMMKDLETPHPGCLYASYSYEPNYFSEEIKKFIKDSILLWRKTFIILINNVLKEYHAKEDIDTESLADLFTVIFEGAFVVSKALKEPDLIAKQLKHLNNYFDLLFESKK